MWAARATASAVAHWARHRGLLEAQAHRDLLEAVGTLHCVGRRHRGGRELEGCHDGGYARVTVVTSRGETTVVYASWTAVEVEAAA